MLAEWHASFVKHWKLGIYLVQQIQNCTRSVNEVRQLST